MGIQLKSKSEENKKRIEGRGNVFPKIEEFRKLLQIDRDALDDVVAQHPFLYMQVAEECTRLSSVRDKLKSEADDHFAQLQLDIRQKAAAAVKREKVTVDEVSARASTNPSYQKLHDSYLALNSQLAQWTTLREAFAQRGYMIRELCGLFASQYWTKSTVTKGNAGDHAVRHVRSSMRTHMREE